MFGSGAGGWFRACLLGCHVGFKRNMDRCSNIAWRVNPEYVEYAAARTKRVFNLYLSSACRLLAWLGWENQISLIQAEF